MFLFQARTIFFLTHIHISNIKFIFFSSEMNQLEIIDQSVLRMIALQLCLEQVWEPLYLQPRYNRKGTLSGIPKTGGCLVKGPKIPRQAR
jgi:hypothetical protein